MTNAEHGLLARQRSRSVVSFILYTNTFLRIRASQRNKLQMRTLHIKCVNCSREALCVFSGLTAFPGALSRAMHR